MHTRYDEKRKLKERQASRRARSDDRADGALTADFLDADDDEGELDGNLGAIRKKFKERRQQPGKRLPGTGVRKQRKARRADNSDDDEGDDVNCSEDDEEEDEGDPHEMDGFLVGEDEDEDEDEAEESEEERRPKKKKAKRGKSLVDDDEDSD